MTSENFYNNPNGLFSYINNTYKNEMSNYETKKIRSVRDITTSVFTDTFLNDINKRIQFLNYTYHIINIKLQTNIDEELINNNLIPLTDDEDVYLVFKGGNVMNHFFYKLFNIESDQIKKEYFKISDVDYSIYIKTIYNNRFILLKSFVKKILMRTLEEISLFFNNYYRNIMNDIKPTNEILYQSENTIDETIKKNIIGNIDSSIIYGYYNECKRILKFINSNYKPDNPINLNVLYDLISTKINLNDEYLLLFKKPDNNYDTTLILKLMVFFKINKILNYFFNDKKHNLNNTLAIENDDDDDDDINIDSNKELEYKSIILKNLKEYLDKNTEYKLDFESDRFKKVTEDNINKLNIIFEQYNKQLINNLYNSNFYEKDLFEMFKINLGNKIKEHINKNLVLYESISNTNGNNLITYNFRPINKDVVINFSKESNMYIYNKDDPTKQYEIKESNVKSEHYISYNSIINILPSSNQNKVMNFDLARIKFGIRGKIIHDKKIDILNTDINIYEKKNKKKLRIPSEFIDVSISNLTDSLRLHYLDEYMNKEPYIFKNKDIAIYAFSIDDLSDDLETVLTNQNSIFPWIDNKYSKRLERLLVFKHLEGHLKNKQNKENIKLLIELCKKIKTNNYIIKFEDIKIFINDDNIDADHKDIILNFLFDSYYSLKSNQNNKLNYKPEYNNIVSLLKILVIHNKLLFTKLNNIDIVLPKEAIEIYNSYRNDILLESITKDEDFNLLLNKYKTLIDNIITYNYDEYDNNINQNIKNITVEPLDGIFKYIITNKYSLYHDKYMKYKLKYKQLKKELDM